MREAPDGWGATACACRLSLTGDFDLVMDGRGISLPHSAERVVACLALAPRPIHRVKLAGILWPDASQSRAARSLRTALWRMRRAGARIAEVHGDRLALTPGIRVDLADALTLTRHLLDDPSDDALARLPILIDQTELLPGWDDEWVVADRERFRLLRLAALERAAQRLLQLGDHGRALETALAATIGDPLRDTARRLVVQIHLSEGNVAAAVHVYEEYRQLLLDDVGVEPSSQMQELVRPHAAAARRLA